MSELVVIAMTGPGLQALEFARTAGHRTTWVHSPRYEFLMSPEQRERGRRLADRVVTLADLHDIPAVLDGLRSAGVDPGSVAGVLSPVHPGAMPAARLAARLGLPGTSPEVMGTAKNKARCREILDEAGIPSLRFGVAGALEQAREVIAGIGLPVIIKPVTGIGKAVTTLARTDADVRRHFGTAREMAGRLAPGMAAELDGRFLIEELAIGPLYSVEVAADGQRITPLVAVRRKTGRENPVLELGSTVPAGLPAAAEREMYDYVAGVCAAIGLGAGVFHVEIMWTSAGPRLIEVNPRIAGGAIPDLVTAATGRNLFELLVRLAAGESAPDGPWPQLAGASHSFITAARDCAVRADLPAGWFEEFRPRLHSGYCSITAGARLRQMTTNMDVLGVVRVVAGTPQEAERDCTGLMAQIETTLGIELTQPAVLDPA